MYESVPWLSTNCRIIIRFCFHAPSDEFLSSVAEGVTAINQAIEAQDERLLMAALTYPRASIYGVTSKCIQEYLEELKNLKDSKKEAGQ